MWDTIPCVFLPGHIMLPVGPDKLLPFLCIMRRRSTSLQPHWGPQRQRACVAHSRPTAKERETFLFIIDVCPVCFSWTLCPASVRSGPRQALTFHLLATYTRLNEIKSLFPPAPSPIIKMLEVLPPMQSRCQNVSRPGPLSASVPHLAASAPGSCSCPRGFAFLEHLTEDHRDSAESACLLPATQSV